MATDDRSGPTPAPVGETSTVAKLIVPAATLAASWGVRKALDGTYRRATGNPPPKASDPAASLTKAILWAAATSAALAIVTVVIDRLAARGSTSS